ncbi:MAG: endonuclease/exonuclease/phosphatase family protein, partial [Saprospiraceae bacterium]|nr:endonuclease/exonuclease/phosphatase family protein [Saprospiraceae bacterium]
IERLYKRLKTLREDNIPFAIGGDFNVIPEDKDCYDPKKWMDDALFQPESRAAFRKLLHLGLTEAFRAMHNGAGHYTFWDYQAGAWPKNHGIRIDHFLLSPELADRLINCTIDKALRALDKPSDHTPIIIEIES